ncbi:MAG: recombination mediator RecR [Bacteroidales bacterium]|nr:recombination mediator RecR [Bacteroidales bacterium]
MTNHSYPSKLLEEAVEQFSRLPGIGRKTAFRLVFHLLRRPVDEVDSFSHAIVQLRKNVKYCKQCNSISDDEICMVCADHSRDQSVVCVVESIKEVISIEATGQFSGVYHVLGGLISPIDGVGPSDLSIELLESRLSSGTIKELILALSPTPEGDTTAFYLFRKFEKYSLTFTTIARGIPIGDEIEYTDSLTLGKSILHRVPFGYGKD